MFIGLKTLLEGKATLLMLVSVCVRFTLASVPSASMFVNVIGAVLECQVHYL